MPKFNRPLTAIFALCPTLLATTVQADYQNEVDLYLTDTDYDSGDKSDGASLGYSHYFNKVDTSTGPWELADYIRRAAYINLSTYRADTDSSTSNSDSKL